MLSLLFKSRVKQHQRTSHTGKVVLVHPYDRLKGDTYNLKLKDLSDYDPTLPVRKKIDEQVREDCRATAHKNLTVVEEFAANLDNGKLDRKMKLAGKLLGLPAHILQAMIYEGVGKFECAEDSYHLEVLAEHGDMQKAHVRTYSRAGKTGKVETVKEHERIYQPKMGTACSCKPGQARDNCRQCEGTGQVIDFAAIRARPLEHEEVSGSEACPACGNPEVTELGSLGSKYWVRCRGCGSDYVHTSQDDLDHDLGPDDMQKAKSLVLTFGKSVVKQHSRKTKTGKTSTVRQYSDKRTKKPAQDKDDQSTWSDSSRKQAAPKGVEITNVGSVDRHRNGMGGKPFSIVKFSYLEPGSEEEQQMVAMVFDEPGAIAVFDQDKLAAGDTSFGSNSWRGDRFEKPLREHIERHTKDLYGHLSEPKEAGDKKPDDAGKTGDKKADKQPRLTGRESKDFRLRG